MSNPYYTHGSFPVTGSPGQSAAMRGELDLVSAAFDLLPVLAGNGGKMVVVNPGGTALTSTAVAFSEVPLLNTPNLWLEQQTFQVSPIVSTLTPLLPVFSDAAKSLVSHAVTGSGSVVMSAGPTVADPTVTGLLRCEQATFAETVSITPTVSAYGLLVLASTAVGSVYGVRADATGASVINMAFQAHASGAATNIGLRVPSMVAGPNNYAIYVDTAVKSYFAGPVGIGTTAPDGVFTVNGGRSVFRGATEAYAIGVGYSSGTAALAGYFGAASNNSDLQFSNAGGGETMRIGNLGCVSIGVGPGYNASLRLQVGAGRTYLSSPGEVFTLGLCYSAATPGAYLGVDGANNLIISNEVGAESVYITSAGRIAAKTFTSKSEYNCGAAGPAITLNPANGQNQFLNLDQNTSISLAAAPGVGTWKWRIWDSVGGRVISWANVPATRWLGMTGPPVFNLAQYGEAMLSGYWDGVQWTLQMTRIGAV